jgi:hypothetical protein
MDLHFIAIVECKLTSVVFCFILRPLIGNHGDMLCNKVNTTANWTLLLVKLCNLKASPTRICECYDRMRLYFYYRSFNFCFNNYDSKNSFRHGVQEFWCNFSLWQGFEEAELLLILGWQNLLSPRAEFYFFNWYSGGWSPILFTRHCGH